MELKLNIYNHKNIIKTYTAESYDVMFGTVEDLINVLNLDGLQTEDNAEFIKIVSQVVIDGFEMIKPLLKDIFDGLTDEELRHAKISDVVVVIMNLIQFTMAEIGKGANGKNR